MPDGSFACVAEPRCLAHSPALAARGCLTARHVVQRERSECGIARMNKVFHARFGAFCNRSVYATGSGALVTLPAMTAAQLDYTYAHVFERHTPHTVLASLATHPKVMAGVQLQRRWIDEHLGRDDGTRPLTIYEMGCMHGSLLASFHSLAAPRHLRCFEPSIRFHPQLTRRFEMLLSYSGIA